MKPLLVLILSLSLSFAALGQRGIDKKQLLGFWMPKDAPEGIHISKDSIYYATYFKSYKYILTKEDTLIIYFDGFINKSKVLVNKDTLILKGQNTNYFIRSK